MEIMGWCVTILAERNE